MKKTAHAKINIALKILGTRADGYHDLDMIFLELPFGDEIRLEKSTQGIELTCSDPSLPCDERNLAFRAAKLMQETYGLTEGVSIHIEKIIPSQAGLGGGSSDAACVLTAMNELYSVGAEDQELERLGEKLGADVPFLVRGGCARARGKGEILTDLGTFPACSILVVKPDVSVSTPWAYRAYDERKKETVSMNIDEAVRAIQKGDLRALFANTGNDLEAPVIEAYPVIGELKKQLLSLGALGAMMTGSGSALFGIFPDENKARQAAEAFAGDPHVQTFMNSI